MCVRPLASKRIKGQNKLIFLSNKTLDISWEYDNPNIIWLPCGNCIECRLRHARNWGSRCYLESLEHKSNYFLTLTYDDENVPRSASGNLTLKKRDYQLFFKRLRKWQKYPKIRYFGSGEYGTRFTKRPHYHFIVFGLEIRDLKFYGLNNLKQPLWTSRKIDKLWFKGNVIIGDVTYETSAYVARYSLKKVGSQIDYGDRVPEFLVMSNRGGIAYNYFKKNFAQIYNDDQLLIKTDKGSHFIKPFRYFDKKAQDDYGLNLDKLKAERLRVSILRTKNTMNNTSHSYKQYLKNVEINKKSSIKNLKKTL